MQTIDTEQASPAGTENSLQGRDKLIFIGLFFIGGMLTDFITVGVLKIIWIIIYGTTYFTIAMTIESSVARTKGKAVAKSAVLSFLAGTILAHLCFVNYTHHASYSMTLVSDNPLTLKAPEFPEVFYITSDKLSEVLKAQNLQQNIPMETESAMDYACAKTFVINSIAGVDIRSDASSHWALRLNKLGVFAHTDLPNLTEDSRWPWCKIVFYRTNF